MQTPNINNQTSLPKLRWDIWDLLLITSAILIVMTIASSLVILLVLAATGEMPPLADIRNGAIDSAALLGNTWAVVALASLNFFVVVLVVPIAMLIRGKLSWELLGFKQFKLWWLAILPVIFAVLYPLVNLVVTGLQTLLYGGLDSWQMELFLPEDFSWSLALVSVLVLGVLVPIGEEIMFRSILYRWLRDTWGVTVGVVVSALVFGSLHISVGTEHVYGVEFTVAIGVALIGAILALVYEYSGSVWTAILMHMAQNTLGVAVGFAALYFGWSF